MSVTATVPVGSPEAMLGLGRNLAGLLRAGDLVVLDGPLGAGKTTLARGLGEGLAIRGRVSSPTFVIARRHSGGKDGVAMLHVDAYRLTAAELADLDLDVEAEDAVAVVEWGSGKVDGWSSDRLLIEFSLASDDPQDARIVTITGVGERWGNVALGGVVP